MDAFRDLLSPFLETSSNFDAYIEVLAENQKFIANNFKNIEGAFQEEEIDRCTFMVLIAFAVVGDVEEKAKRVRAALCTVDEDANVFEGAC